MTLPFEILEEGWAEYTLNDKLAVRARITLVDLQGTGDLGEMRVAQQVIVLVPREERGLGPRPATKVVFRTREAKSTGKSVSRYRTAKGEIDLRMSVHEFEVTDGLDENGDPIVRLGLGIAVENRSPASAKVR